MLSFNNLKEVESMNEGHCPQCNHDDINIIRRTSKDCNEFIMSYHCKKCGKMVDIEKLDIDCRDMEVRINGRETRLIVEDWKVGDNVLELFATSRNLTFKEIRNGLVGGKHTVRHCNSVKKLITESDNEWLGLFSITKVDYNNHALFIFCQLEDNVEEGICVGVKNEIYNLLGGCDLIRNASHVLLDDSGKFVVVLII